ncbi:lysophospholipid acyltransferase family protein [Spiribacter vilamensis]|uniref:KDO2-lipid IV(A) lauroyltransferase n=1 Tax=Spiribacter vilamensis TaxID=531306 RepID=A0A4Q8D262_9GAMM|nr:lipid A biosynthesis acyltransferase [Spiribacter vilamensis]RZU99412.1 KDO2-lipid IV(A) lauroyltransferase [Spiribacter vilamensis]
MTDSAPPSDAGSAPLHGRAKAIDIALRVLSRLSLSALHRLGSAVGWLTERLRREEWRVARVNADICFPDWSEVEREHLARAALRENAKGLIELAAIWHWPVPRLLGLIREVEGADVVDELLAEGRGLLVIAPHHGSWEMLQMWLAQRVRLNSLYRPPRWKELEVLLNRGRSRSGAMLWPARPSGIRALFKALKAGEAVGVLPDQSPPSEGVFAPFFGRDAKTMTLFGKLAGRTGVPVVIGWAERLERGTGYRLHWRQVTEPVGDVDPAVAAAALNREIEGVVREKPEQYLWTYTRFEKRESGRPNPYKKQKA